MGVNMAVSDSTSLRPPYPAREFSLPGVALDVTHTSAGKAIVRTAVVDIGNTTFLERGGTRKTSTATATFLEHVAVFLEDTVQLPNEESPRKVLRVINRFASLTRSHGVKYDGRLTVVLLR